MQNLSLKRRFSLGDGAWISSAALVALCLGAGIGIVRGEMDRANQQTYSFPVVRLEHGWNVADAAVADFKLALSDIGLAKQTPLPAEVASPPVVKREIAAKTIVVPDVAPDKNKANSIEIPVETAKGGESLFEPKAKVKIAAASASTARDQDHTKHLIEVENVAALEKTFAAMRFELSGVREGHAVVPRVYLAKFPSDLRAIKSPKNRKSVFFRTMLPLVLRVNEEIRELRQQIIAAFGRIDASTETVDDRKFLADIGEAYGAKSIDRETLLSHVDAVPPSLALAQSAEESGWGTSRFARKGNAVFGQKTFTLKQGIVPKGPERLKNYAIRSFGDIYSSVRSYMHNLNSHRAYREMRQIRAKLRRARQPVDGRILIQTLKRYSERGQAYIKTIDTIIRINRLQQFDDAKLAAQRVVQTAIRAGEQRS